jgi:hypothetical protein
MTYFAQAHHIIFENVGSMAGAISYMHAKLTVNISAVEEQYLSYKNNLENFLNNLEEPPKDQLGTHYYEENLFKLKHQHYQSLTRVINMYLIHSQDIYADIFNLRSMMPTELPKSSNIIDDNPPKLKGRHNRDIHQLTNFTVNQLADRLQEHLQDQAQQKITSGAPNLIRPSRFLGAAALGLGAYGTYLGLFNKKQIHNIRQELQETRANQNRLVEVVQKHDRQLEELRNNLHQLTSQLLLHKVHDPGLLSAQLLRIEMQLKSKMNVIVHAFQQAQNHRLSVDLLTQNQLRSLYAKLQEHAKEYGCTLLTENPSDLFQLEVSYFSDGLDLQLMLHIPMVPKDSMLRLFKLHPFPLPLNKQHFLLPAVKNDILAISSGSKRYSAQFTSTDLLGCHQVNQVYLCERHGVLQKNMNNTCLGALYLQDFDAAQELCDMEVVAANEVVYQLLRNWFLIFSPQAQTAPIECRNGTQSEFHVGAGITKLYLSPGCRATFQNHLLLSDLAIRLPSDILHFEWNWDPASLANLAINDVPPLLQQLEEGGISRPSLEDLRELKVQNKKTQGFWFHTVHFIGNAVVFGLLAILIIFAIYKIYLFRKKQISLIEYAQASIFRSRQPASNPVATYAPSAHHPDQIQMYPHVPEDNSQNPLLNPVF